MSRRIAVVLLASLVVSSVVTRPTVGQEVTEFGQSDALQRHHPELHDQVVRLERAHGVLFGELVRASDARRGSGGGVPDSAFEADLLERVRSLAQGDGKGEAEAQEAEAGYAALGERGSGIIRWGQAFQREVLSILSDPGVGDRRAALARAITRYESRPDVALPLVPKDMDILYGHPYALDFRTAYADLDGLVWAGHWLRLAATEPLTDLADASERAAGIDTVMTRFRAKLSDGEPPASFPSEIPLAPAIAPGLIWLSPEAAMIWDNLSMLMEVVADVVASPETVDVEQAVSAAFDFFADPELAVTDRDQWEIMALRHGIFFQGGYPLAVMTENERNVGGHAAHLQGGAPLMTIPGMPRR